MELQHSVEVKKQRKGVTPLLQQDHKRSDDVQFINNIKELLDMCMWSNVMVITCTIVLGFYHLCTDLNHWHSTYIEI